MVTAAREKSEIEGLVEEAGLEKGSRSWQMLPGGLRAGRDRTVERFRKVDVLVNTAGRGIRT